MSESARREVSRELESDYWRLVNMRSERQRVQDEIKTVAARLDALRLLIATYEPGPAREEPK